MPHIAYRAARRSLLGGGLATAVVLLISCSSNKGTFTLINKAGEPIARASVTICEQTIALKDIDPGQSGTGSYEVRADSHYIIAIVFRSGRMLNKETGYVTSGMDFRHEITISDSGIEITDTGIN